MPLQALPPSARDYRSAQNLEIRAALAAVKRQWQRMPTGGSWDDAWARIAPTITGIMTTAQARLAAGALAYIPAVLEDTGQSANYDPDGVESISPLLGVAGDGRPVDTLAYGAVVNAGTRYDTGMSAFQALQSGGRWLSMSMGTALSDTARSAESLSMGTRRVQTYVRMLTPPSCSRCAILAGQVAYAATAFKRHPGCDCRNIPANESVADDLTVDPHAYFESLSPESQDRTFGAGDAEAIRSGADIFQVVNSHRGMRAAQIGGRKVWVTSEGTTRRGFAYSRLAPSGGTAIDRTQTAVRITRNGPERRTIQRRVANRPRLMPSTIRSVATDRDDYLRLLRANGYLI